jgi:hypothetical protein
MRSCVGVDGYMTLALPRTSPPETTDDDGVEGNDAKEDASEEVDERESCGIGLDMGAEATLAMAADDDDMPAEVSGKLERWNWKLGGLWKWSRNARLAWKLGSCLGML